jgi:hypothetical protein
MHGWNSEMTKMVRLASNFQKQAKAVVQMIEEVSVVAIRLNHQLT